MRKSLFAVTAALALSPLAARAHSQPSPNHGYYTPPRSPWYLSLGVGTGTGWTYDTNGTRSFHETLTYDGSPQASDNGRIGINFQVGATLTPQLLLGFDFTLIHGFGDLVDHGRLYDTYEQIWNGDVMLTLFPMGRGLFFRVGTGLSVLSTGISDGGPPYDTYHRSGINGTLGVGYAFPLTHNLNLTVNADYSRQWYGSHRDTPDDPDGSSFFLVYLGLAWY